MVFNVAGDLLRANKDVEPAPAVLDVADWDEVLTAADITKLAGIEAGATADQIASEVPNTPSGNLVATNVQDALNELQTDVDSKASITDTVAGANSIIFSARISEAAGMSIGDVVYISGATGSQMTASLAINSDFTKVEAVAICIEAGANNATVNFQNFGELIGLDTSAWNEGDKLYLSNVSGELTNVHPSGLEAVMDIGTVVRSHATLGNIFININEHTIVDEYDGILRNSAINTSSGTAASVTNTLVNDVGYQASMSLTSSNYTNNPNAFSIYTLGYGNMNFYIDGAKDYVWVTDETDSHNFSATEKMRLTAAGKLETKQQHINHTATETDDHALEIDVDAAGFGDVKAIDVVYTTGAIVTGQDEAIILANIDESSATGGSVTGLEVIATEGSADVNGMLLGVGVNPIEHLSGSFTDMDSALVNAADRLAEFTSDLSDIEMFTADNDTVTIGNATKFEEIEFLLSTLSSRNIQPTFEFSTGVGTWDTFTPVDGTNGMLNNGVIVWLDADIPTWAVGTGSEYLIRITRTRNGSITSPIESKVQIAVASEYKWDKNGNICANKLAVGADSSVAITTDATLEVRGTDGAFLPPTLTTAQRDSLTPTAGMQIYNSTTDATENYVSGAWTVMGSGSGGGLDTFFTDDHEKNGIDNHTTGNNATFDNGGTLDGTLSLDVTTQLNGNNGLKYVMSTSSTNDFIASESITIAEKQQNNVIGFELYYKYDGDDDDIRFVIYDDTNNLELTDSIVYLKKATNSKRFSAQAYIPDGVTALKYGFQVVTGNNTKILLVDDVIGTSSPFVAKDFQKINSVMLEGSDGRAITGNTESISFSGSGTGWVSGANGSTPSNGNYYEVQYANSVISLQGSTDNAGGGYGGSINLYLNGSLHKIIAENTADRYRTFSYISKEGEFSIGDKLALISTASITLVNTTSEHFLNIVETQVSESVIGYNSKNTENSMVRLHTGNGHGSTNNKIRRFSTTVDNLGTSITYTDSATDGSSFTINKTGIYHLNYNDARAAGGAQIGLSLNSTELTTAIQTITAADILQTMYTSGANLEGSVSWSGILNRGDVVRVHTDGQPDVTATAIFTISNGGLEDIVGVPVPIVGYVYDHKTAGTGGGTATTNTVHTRDLNAIGGDFDKFGSLAADQMTLDSGKYLVNILTTAYKTGRTQCFLYDADNTDYLIEGKVTFAVSGAGDQADVEASGVFTINEQTTFEVRHWIDSGGTLGLGVDSVRGTNPASNEVYTVVEIIKLY